MKLKKYKMAIYYLSKAVKFLEKSNDKVMVNNASMTVNNQQIKGATNPLQKINPNENLNNSAS